MNRSALPALLLALVVLSAGCSSVGERLVVARQGVHNKMHNKAYVNAVAEQARDQTLLGTWTRTYTYMTKKLFPPQNTQTLSLFKDGTYALREQVSGLLPAVRTTEGTWTRDDNALITLVPDDKEIKTKTYDLSRWSNAFAQAERELLSGSAPRYSASVLMDEDSVPIVVFPSCEPADIEGFAYKSDHYEAKVVGSFAPDAKLVIQADRLLRERLEQEKPGKAYLRQVGGFLGSSGLMPRGRRYLYFQLTAANQFDDEPALGGFGWPGFLDGFNKVFDGGDNFGYAIYDVEYNHITTLVFNDNV